MSAGFTRRFGFFPGVEVITQIEGVIIVDLPPPGGIQGTGTGTVCCVGEFPDATYAVDVATTGIVTGNPQAVEIFSGQDLLNKVGGFDETIGKFGADQGNGFVTLRNKRYQRLVVVPIDNITPAAGSMGAIRLWRQLPTNISGTNPTPIVPVPGAVVEAGREFGNAANRARNAKRFSFADTPAYLSGIDGSVATAAAAATQTFTSAGSNFTTSLVQVGDILVVGVIGTSLGVNAQTFRVTAVGTTTLTVELLTGPTPTFTFTTETNLPWRVHAAAVADSAGAVAAVHVSMTGASGYQVPARPIGPATIAAALPLAPTVVPPAGTANSYDPLSGLAGSTHPTAALIYDANVGAPNVAGNATLDARYQNAIDAALNDDDPASSINVMVSSRKSLAIRAKIKSHVGVASERGLTRTGVNAPSLTTVALATVVGTPDPGVGANRSDRVDYSWPGCRMSVPEAVGFAIATADGKTTTDGILDDSFDAWLASILSVLPPERNPGQAGPPVETVMAPVLGFQRGAPKLAQNDYVALRQAGVAALRFDKVAGPLIQSGITTSLVSGQKNISRRRMADFIQDSVASRMVQFSKQLLTTQLKDSAEAEVNAFLNELLSPDNPAAQRISGYQVDTKTGNTPALEAAGIFVIIIRVRLLATADFIVLQTEIGEGVVITEAA